MRGTHLSFEYWGAIQARTFLLDRGAPGDQADAVYEAIIRHAELGESGTITSLALLMQLSTVLGKWYIFLSNCSRQVCPCEKNNIMYKTMYTACLVLWPASHGHADNGSSTTYARPEHSLPSRVRTKITAPQHILQQRL